MEDIESSEPEEDTLPSLNEIKRLSAVIRKQFLEMNDTQKQLLETTWVSVINDEPYEFKYGNGHVLVARRIGSSKIFRFMSGFARGGSRYKRKKTHYKKSKRCKKNKRSKKRIQRKK
jgi:hypothetical protein